ncbi:MAG TPA: signal peptidase II [Tenericutes bacterium]|nr:signal peptidase II [Mycoplasmatota bacterium]
MLKIFTIITLLFVVIDQAVKLIVKINMNVFESIEIIKNFFYITYVQNEGAAWGILSGNRLILILSSIFTLILIYFCFIKGNTLSKVEEIIYGILFAGILGNLFDRVLYGYVIDYLDFNIFNYNFPVFNIADICIVIGMFLLVFINYKGSVKNGKNNS